MNRVEEIEKRLAALEEALGTGKLVKAALAFATTDIRFLLDALKESSARIAELESELDRHTARETRPTPDHERIEFLEKALDAACDYANMQVVTLKPGDTYSGIHKFRHGMEVIIIGGYVPGEVVCTTEEEPELAQYLKEQGRKP